MSKYLLNSQVLKDFGENCDALCASKLILADKKISNLLKTIAASEDFCRLLKQCLENFNYKIEFLKSRKPHGIKKDKYILNLPVGETLIAYVFCLLCEFENKEKDLTEFLIEYYDFNELFADGYKNFCNAVIVPFKNTVTELCSAEEQILTPAQDNAKSLNIEKEQYIKINKAYKELLRNIDKEGRLSADERKEFKLVADAFIQACTEENTHYAAAFLSALKIMCNDYRFLNNKINIIDKIANNKEL